MAAQRVQLVVGDGDSSDDAAAAAASAAAATAVNAARRSNFARHTMCARARASTRVAATAAADGKNARRSPLTRARARERATSHQAPCAKSKHKRASARACASANAKCVVRINAKVQSRNGARALIAPRRAAPTLLERARAAFSTTRMRVHLLIALNAASLRPRSLPWSRALNCFEAKSAARLTATTSVGTRRRIFKCAARFDSILGQFGRVDSCARAHGRRRHHCHVSVLTGDRQRGSSSTY